MTVARIKELMEIMEWRNARSWVHATRPEGYDEAVADAKKAVALVDKMSETVEKEAFKLRDELLALMDSDFVSAEEQDEFDQLVEDLEEDDTIDSFMSEVLEQIYPFSPNLVYNYQGYHSHSDIDSFWEPSTC